MYAERRAEISGPRPVHTTRACHGQVCDSDPDHVPVMLRTKEFLPVDAAEVDRASGSAFRVSDSEDSTDTLTRTYQCGGGPNLTGVGLLTVTL